MSIRVNDRIYANESTQALFDATFENFARTTQGTYQNTVGDIEIYTFDYMENGQWNTGLFAYNEDFQTIEAL